MDVVSYIGVSRTTLLTKLKDEVGVTLGSYINNQKLKEAKLLLEYSDKSILDISLSLGYSSQSYFQNSFKHARKPTMLLNRTNTCSIKATQNLFC